MAEMLPSPFSLASQSFTVAAYAPAPSFPLIFRSGQGMTSFLNFWNIGENGRHYLSLSDRNTHTCSQNHHHLLIARMSIESLFSAGPFHSTGTLCEPLNRCNRLHITPPASTAFQSKGSKMTANPHMLDQKLSFTIDAGQYSFLCRGWAQRWRLHLCRWIWCSPARCSEKSIRSDLQEPFIGSLNIEQKLQLKMYLCLPKNILSLRNKVHRSVTMVLQPACSFGTESDLSLIGSRGMPCLLSCLQVREFP